MRLHHNPISTCAQNVRPVLSEKQLDVEDALEALRNGGQALLAALPDIAFTGVDHD